MKINRLVILKRNGEQIESLSDTVCLQTALAGFPDAGDRLLAEGALKSGQDYRFSVSVCGVVLSGRLVPAHLPPKRDLRRKEPSL